MMLRNLRNRRRLGNSMVEFALGSGVLFAVFSGTFQFGFTFFEYNALANAVNAGAKYAALRPYDSSTATPSSAFLTSVQNMVVYGDPSGTGNPVVPGLQPSHVQIQVTFSIGVPSKVAVYVTGYTIDSVFGRTTLVNKPLARFSYQGIYSPY